MKLPLIFRHPVPASELPGFIREIKDIRGVRVLRLQGIVGKEIGGDATSADKAAAKSEDAFIRPLLLDFSGTTGWDFSTVSYLVLALRHRMAAHAQIGIIHPSSQLIAELEMAKLDGLFRVFATEEQALVELTGTRRGPANPKRDFFIPAWKFGLQRSPGHRDVFAKMRCVTIGTVPATSNALTLSSAS